MCDLDQVSIDHLIIFMIREKLEIKHYKALLDLLN